MSRFALAAAILLATTALASAGPGSTPGSRVVVTESSCEIIEPIRFTGATAELAPESNKMLDAIAGTLEGNPELRLIEIRAFGVGAKRDRQAIAELRARAIADQLVERGIDAGRLRAVGVARPPRGSSGGTEIRILYRGT